MCSVMEEPVSLGISYVRVTLEDELGEENESSSGEQLNNACEKERWAHPRTAADFALLQSEVNTWWAGENKSIRALKLSEQGLLKCRKQLLIKVSNMSGQKLKMQAHCC